MKRSGTADLPLHGGRVPQWLAQRMSRLGGAITETIVLEYGRDEFLRRMSDPFWFQALGCVLGMDWHSSGITTSVMGALKKALNPMSHELGIYICGGRGKHSRQTPAELMAIGNKTGLDALPLVKASKLSAKVDNTAIQDGFQLYLHSFILSSDGQWTVVQQGMNNGSGMARRYHWHSAKVQSFVEEPHTFIYGQNQGMILNLTATDATPTRAGMVDVSREKPLQIISEMKKLSMPRHHDVRLTDVDLKRLGSVLALAWEHQPSGFEELLMLEGLGPRTLQSLTLVSELIHGTPSRFSDPARYSFAHGGKDGHPFPVPVKVYDKTIEVLSDAVEKAKLDYKEKSQALKSLHTAASGLESHFHPQPEKFEEVLEQERNDSYKYGGRTVMGFAKPPNKNEGKQLKLF